MRTLAMNRARSIAIAWTLLIFIGCLWPERELPNVQVPSIDKWVHFIMFGGFTFWWLGAYYKGGWKIFPATFIAGCAFGLVIECLQYMFPALGRNFDLRDILADSMGSALGLSSFVPFIKFRLRKKL